jgi:hypothetical protein
MDDLFSTIATLDSESPRPAKLNVEATASSMVDSSTGSPSQAQQHQPVVGCKNFIIFAIIMLIMK